MNRPHATMSDWLTTAEAVDLLDASRRPPPSLIDTSRAPFSFGLVLLIPVGLVVGALVFLASRIPAALWP
jgi:hypothetical protein